MSHFIDEEIRHLPDSTSYWNLRVDNKNIFSPKVVLLTGSI